MATNSTIIVWFRADLRTHDHPALAAAVRDANTIVPVFILDDTQLTGKFSSANRNRFLLESLKDLRQALRKKGGDLVIRQGSTEKELLQLVTDTGAKAVYYIADYTPFAVARDKKIEEALKKNSVSVRSFGGKLVVSSVHQLTTKTGSPYKVFTPYWKAWSQVERRSLAPTPRHIALPSIKVGSLPSVETTTEQSLLSDNVAKGGETTARSKLHDFLDGPIHEYYETGDYLDKDNTSRLSPYIHFGCISVREIETMLPDSRGAEAWYRQLAWRDFYYYVLFNFPNPKQEFQERYRSMQWSKSDTLLGAWKRGQTGYPVVDAAMRQLRSEGWMHNRARLIVGSFLTKDLGIDWREGEAHFMQWLVDGDMANNNGNWQWIGSVGVDPAPVFRRLYNPSTQQNRFDQTGAYVRRYVPELRQVPSKLLSQPWRMSDKEQIEHGCKIGKDYPKPVVDHKQARQQALERYRAA